VIVATVFVPDIAVVPVSPAPIVIVPAVVGYLRITTPEPPARPVAFAAEFISPPFPVLAGPATLLASGE
jgi:hypothetical protein